MGAGYLHDPERTAKSFIGNVKWSSGILPEGIPLRMYKTGDLVKYNEDGTMLVSSTWVRISVSVLIWLVSRTQRLADEGSRATP